MAVAIRLFLSVLLSLLIFFFWFLLGVMSDAGQGMIGIVGFGGVAAFFILPVMSITWAHFSRDEQSLRQRLMTHAAVALLMVVMMSCLTIWGGPPNMPGAFASKEQSLTTIREISVLSFVVWLPWIMYSEAMRFYNVYMKQTQNQKAIEAPPPDW